ncbi:HPP family protein [Salinigranum sp. GCM10025319]|uniref:HPP family protein n=1 Tax=Salinigranum sp. GCM10025319 TaxID=3252687 RepID=UPI0036215299
MCSSPWSARWRGRPAARSSSRASARRGTCWRPLATALSTPGGSSADTCSASRGGLVAYHALASGLLITTTTPAFAPSQLRLAASGVAAVVLTTAAMLRTDLVHPPACATTLIVALGLLSSIVEAGVVLASVVVLVGVHAALRPYVPALSPADAA